MQKHNPYTLPTLDQTEQERRIILSLESIADAIEEAHALTVETLHFSYVIPAETDQLTDALSEAIQALKTAYTLAEALRSPAHLDQR